MNVKKTILTTLALLGAGPLFADEAPVATLGMVDGVVVVNQGEHFTQARRGLPVHRGDRIFVMEGAQAELAYEGRCRLRLSSNSFLVVGSAQECATGHVDVRSFGPHYAAAIGLDSPTATDAEEEAPAAANEGKGAGDKAKWAVPATLSGVVLYALIAAGGGAKGTPSNTPVSAQ